MLQLYSNLPGMRIIGQHGTQKIARVRDVIVDHEQGKIEALRIDRGNYFISAVDVISWKGPLEVVDDSVFVEPQEILRLHELLKKNIGFINQRVITNFDEYLGVLYDFEFDITTAAIVNILVGKIFLFLKYDCRLIAAQNIIEVRQNAVVIKDSIRQKTPSMKKNFNLETCS